MRTLLVIVAQLIAVALVVVLIVLILFALAGMTIDPQGCGEVRDGVVRICYGPVA